MSPIDAIVFAWCWFGAGLLSGIGLGLGFARDGWLGGYDAWPRRMVRLGHIAFFGTGLLCLALGLTAAVLSLDGPSVSWAVGLTLMGSATMPVVCFLSAWRKPLRHLFVLPVSGLLGGTGLLTFLLLGVWS